VQKFGFIYKIRGSKLHENDHLTIVTTAIMMMVITITLIVLIIIIIIIISVGSEFIVVLLGGVSVKCHFAFSA